MITMTRLGSGPRRGPDKEESSAVPPPPYLLVALCKVYVLHVWFEFALKWKEMEILYLDTYLGKQIETKSGGILGVYRGI